MYPWTGDKSFLALYIPVSKWHYYYFFHVAKWLNMLSVKIGNPMGPAIWIQVGKPGTCIQLPCHVASSGWPQASDVNVCRFLLLTIFSVAHWICGPIFFFGFAQCGPPDGLLGSCTCHIGMRERVRVGWDLSLCRFRNCICFFPWILVWRFMTSVWPG